MKPEELFLQNLQTIDRISAFVCRRNHLNFDDTVEFIQEVKFRLIEEDYAILRNFKGDSRLSTYLTSVISRLMQNVRAKRWGNWRPCAEARRLGDKAIALDRLTSRDGHTFAEAVEILTTPAGSPFTVEELKWMYASLPPRMPRPALVEDDGTVEVEAKDCGADELIQARDSERIARLAIEAIDRMGASLPAEERLILRMRFCENRKISEIARRLDLDQKRLYKRLEKLFGQVRHALHEAGVTAEDIGLLLDRGDQELQFDLLGAAENSPFRPSHSPDEVPGEGEQCL